MSEGKKKEFDKKELKAKIEKATERLSLLERQAREAKIPILILLTALARQEKDSRSID